MSLFTLPAKKTKTGAKQNVTPSLVQWRFVLVIALVVSVFTGLGVRAAYIQVIAPDNLIQQGDSRTMRTRNMPAYRGIITDRNGVELAVSVPVRAIYADPKIIHEQGGLEQRERWEALADVLGRDVESLRSKVQNPKRRFVYLQRQVSPAMADYVAKLAIPGIYLRRESRRYYPNGEVTAQLIGITDVDDTGIEGLERLYNDWLTGTPGSKVIRRDAKGRQVEILKTTDGEKAGDLTLTIDQRIQALAYREIKEAMLYYQAASASAIVVDVHSGDILAMVNAPSFNPNDRSNVSPHRMRNRVITDAFEPGSSLKPIAVLSALEFGSVKVDDVIDTNPGWMRLGGSLVKDHRNLGKLTLEEIIQHSSNMGTSKLALGVPKPFLLDTYYNMGLMSDTGTNLPGESNGLFHERSRWSDFELATLSFGYGISVTTAQLARMYATIANGGISMPLNIVKNTQNLTYQAEPQRVVSEKNAKAVLAMLESVTQRGGTATKAAVPGYRVGGKTGTSRKAIAGGYGDEYVNIFAGVAPLTDPQIVTVVLINEPGGDLYHGGDTAAPVFSAITGGALQLLNILPDDKQVTSTTWLNGGRDGS
ncbi:penicillin-binding transpeptidase domain-containing protein [Alteromonas sp. C1M14]|uniref:peptidoglycan D,D-transpeptidase FtsI family protein n=1 Tax=Alteromonas sp. C1M14 TaxID=2841567 RepID=UPI001C08BE3F|nr:penicillin-binding transpeptidase domain-containing protein [Alteromonas sp. C1M14]MBU2979421.1 peptidoglycan glycosyltransferase FtsI [Alteromonas sp. C1M14]